MSTRYKYIFGLFVFVLIISSGSLFYGCGSDNHNNNGIPDSTVTDDQLTTQQLVTRYCAKCHALTPPNLLTSDVWNYHTLPSMATKMGISIYGNSYFKDEKAKGISLVNWQKIVAYYLKLAPAVLQSQKRPDSLLNDWAGFTIKVPKNNDAIKVAYTTAVGVDTATHKIFSNDAMKAKLFKWDANLNGTPIASTPSPAVNMLFQNNANGNDNLLLTCTGELAPMDFPNGKIVSLDANASQVSPQYIETDLSRPVHIAQGDINKDGLMDYVISSSGKSSGSLIWLKQNKDKTFSRVVIKSAAGAVQAIIKDFNNDGWPDVMALFGAVNEGLSLFINNKQGGFTERVLLQFPPTYGSTSFQLTDVNHDGKPDLIYSCGYNYRDSRILKPYHGLYIYLNTGDYHFKQSYFYPINGCTRAIATDFDGDGDIDIATSAFFADLKTQPAESFIYFEQDKTMHFKPHAIPVSKYGRWFSMDVGDYNSDGKPDIVLGNYSKGMTTPASIYTGNNVSTPFIVLENHTKK